jgi:hypothetical protein
MKNLRRISIAFAFTLALTIPAFAGEIETTKTSPPPSQPQTTTVNGEIETGLTGQDETGSGEASATDSATAAVLNLLQTVLALF